MSRVMQAAMPEIKCRNGPTDLEVAASADNSGRFGKFCHAESEEAVTALRRQVGFPGSRGGVRQSVGVAAVTDCPVRRSRVHLHEMDFAEPIAVLTATVAAQIGQKEI